MSRRRRRSRRRDRDECANAEAPVAVAWIFRVKERPPSHPLIVHMAAPDHLDDWVKEVPQAARLLAEHIWPGLLTPVLRRGHRVPLEASGGVTAPSANRFGSVSPTPADHVRAELGDAVDFVLDGGSCRGGVESTIVDVTGEAQSILRPAGVTREDLEAVLGHPVAIPPTSGVRVPGQHPSHYAPRARVVLIEPETVVAEAEFAQEAGHQVGVLLPPFLADAGVKAHAVVAPARFPGHLRACAGFLRELDRQGCDLIVASLPVKEGLGPAVANLLRRAVGPRPTA
ncbi:L-threonylcarbamoyladenylate synthase [Streptomyces microflavus]|uniref:L-threonylcarbamoyladenylate synthase n=1 Tax=Streptomyces microflavus TaxID=1919 RepID=UPI0033CE43E4